MVIPRDGCFYPTLTRIMDYFSCSLYNQTEFNALNTTMRNFDWSCLLHGSVHEASYLFNDIFLEMVKTCITSKKLRLDRTTNLGTIQKLDELHVSETDRKVRQLKRAKF